MKKYNLRCQHCGQDHYVNNFFLHLLLILKEEIHKTCPKCHKTSTYELISHIVHDATSDYEKKANNELKLKELYKRG